MSFVFLNPLFFLLFIPVFLSVIFFYKQKSGSKSFSAFSDLKKVYGKDSFFYKLYFLYIILFFSFVILFLANPSLEFKGERVDREAVDIEIVLDISYSMIAKDLKPNRLEVAKGVIMNFLDKVDYARVGMVVFAGRPFEFFSLNSDTKKLKEKISFLDTDTINQNIFVLGGTALGDAMVLASSQFDFEDEKLQGKKKISKGNIIILITDGEVNRGEDLRLMLKYIVSKGIKVYTIGIGGSKETYIELFDGFFGFNKVPVGPLDEETLKKISFETNGKYFRASSKGDLKQIFQEISKEERKVVKFIDYDSFKFVVFIFALLFLFLIINLRFKKFKNN